MSYKLNSCSLLQLSPCALQQNCLLLLKYNSHAGVVLKLVFEQIGIDTWLFAIMVLLICERTQSWLC